MKIFLNTELHYVMPTDVRIIWTAELYGLQSRMLLTEVLIVKSPFILNLINIFTLHILLN